MTNFLKPWIVACLLLAPCTYSGVAAPARTYHLANQFIIGGEGGWDYLSIDTESRRLYVSHSKQIEVLDADSGKIVGIVTDTLGVHGAAIAPDLKRGYSSNGGDSSVTIFELTTFKIIKKVPVNRPDFILYDAFSGRVFPMNKKITVLDAGSGDKAGEIDLGGEPEAAVSNGRGTLYVNLEDKASIAVIDAKALKVVRTYPVEHCTAPHSLSYDDENGRLFVGCTNGFHVVDVNSGKLVGGSVMCGGVDAAAFDPETKLVFESCGEGILSVLQQLTPNTYDLVQSVPTQLHARTMALDRKTKRVFLSTADMEWTQNADPKSKVTLRQQVKPGTFRILVLEP